MRSNGSSEYHQNNNLKVVIAFGNFIKIILFLGIAKKRKITEKDSLVSPKSSFAIDGFIQSKEKVFKHLKIMFLLYNITHKEL